MGIVIAIIIWIICAGACVGMAEVKGYNKVTFGIIGFIFGIIAVIIVAFLPDLNKRKESESEDQS